jgi:hypothetical protein
MVKVSTLFHRVDGFDKFHASSTNPDKLDQDLEDQYLHNLLNPLIYDPGDKLVNAILKKI